MFQTEYRIFYLFQSIYIQTIIKNKHYTLIVYILFDKHIFSVQNLELPNSSIIKASVCSHVHQLIEISEYLFSVKAATVAPL